MCQARGRVQMALSVTRCGSEASIGEAGGDVVVDYDADLRWEAEEIEA